MSRTLALLCLALSLPACGDKDPDGDDTGAAEDTGDTPQATGCTSTELSYDGPEAPTQGDEWTVWMKCDGALMTGAYVIRTDPADFAEIDENVITWVNAGTATLRVQSGSYREEVSVTVTENPS